MTPLDKFLNGRTIITREPAYLSEAFGKKFPEPKQAKGIFRILLDDESIGFECGKGDYASDDIQQVVRHMAKHADGINKYSDKVVDKLLKYKEIELPRGRGWAVRVAERLNREKVPTASGKPWLAVNVSSIIRFHETARAALVTEAAPPGEHDPMTAVEASLKAVESAPRTIDSAVSQILELAEWLALQAEKACDHDDYAVIKEKAVILDQMRSFMGPGRSE